MTTNVKSQHSKKKVRLCKNLIIHLKKNEMKERQNKTFLTTKHTSVQLKVQIIINIQVVFVIFEFKNIFFLFKLFTVEFMFLLFFWRVQKPTLFMLGRRDIQLHQKSITHKLFSCWKKSLFYWVYPCSYWEVRSFKKRSVIFD